MVILASYAPLFARIGYAQWAPDMIWFNETDTYPTASYYVQKMYGENMGTVLVPMHGQEKELRKEGIYISISFDEKDGEYILKAVNAAKEEKYLELTDAREEPVRGTVMMKELRKDVHDAETEAGDNAAETSNAASGADNVAEGKSGRPEPVCYEERSMKLDGMLVLAPESFVVVRMKMPE